jgi:hypothetical protein
MLLYRRCRSNNFLQSNIVDQTIASQLYLTIPKWLILSMLVPLMILPRYSAMR